ncbi:MAG: hypothetical protein ACI85K_000934 [Hyphomicrobiaceae bacterium]|jgi:hypothetical protein
MRRLLSRPSTNSDFDLAVRGRQARVVETNLQVVEVAFARDACQTRLPFRFGGVTLHSTERLTCRVTARDSEGREATGWSSDLLIPRWFRKDTVATPQQDADELVASAEAAAACYSSLPANTVFGLWRQVLAERIESQPIDQPDLLVRGYGVAMVERALLDASCRLVGMPFAEALRADVFGFRPGEVHAQLADWQWQADLPKPRSHVTVRHTVGMLDRLRIADVDPADRVNDGLPEALDQDIDEYGVAWFKVKIGAGLEQDRARLLDLAAFFAERDLSPELTLDGNEQYQDIAQLADVLDAVAADPKGRKLVSRIAFIEQPLARAHSFDPGRHRGIERVTKYAPLILDEADATPQSFVRALELGYRGVSVKNCKGVFRALCNFGIAKSAAGRFQSGEDLTNVGVLSLQQDLLTGAVLGLPHVERNGHHYFRGLDHLPGEVAANALAAHSDLYRPLSAANGGGVALRIVAGKIDITSVLSAVGYGQSMSNYAQSLQVAATS